MSAAHHAFEKLYADNYAFVWHSLRRLGVPTLAIDDAVQDTFVTAFRRQDSFDGRSPRAWLYCIGRRVALNADRSRRRRERRHQEAPAPVAMQRPSEGQVGAQRALAGFLEALDGPDRELFVLSEIDGLTGPELVAALGRKLPTIYGRIRVLRARLRTFAGEDFDPSEHRRAPPTQPRSASWIAMQPWLTAAAAPAPALGGVLGGLWGAASTPWISGTIIATLVGGAALWSTRGETPSSPRPTQPRSTSSPTPAVATPAATAARVVAAEPSPRATSRAALPMPTPTPRAPPASAPKRAAPLQAKASQLAEETQQLREVKAQLRAGDPGAALDTLAALDQRFPRSVQSDLRSVLHVEALCASGRAEQARDVAETLRAHSPNSPMMRRLASTCAGERPSAQTQPAQTQPAQTQPSETQPSKP